MKRFVFILIFFIGAKLFAAEVIFRPLTYSVDAIFDYRNGIRYTCDAQGWIQNELVFYQLNDETGDTIILFRAPMYNNCLKGTPQWFNRNGELIREIETDVGGCTVHASSYYFIMPGNIRMSLSALIRKSDYWYEDQPAVKRMEEFHKEGYLEKRVNYYENGFRKSEVNYVYWHQAPSYFNTYDNDWNYRKSGPAIYYYDNGVKESEGNLDGSAHTGTWKYYDRDGVLIKEQINYKPDSATTVLYFTSGTVKSTYTEYNHKYLGDEKSFYEAGELRSYTHYNYLGKQDTTRNTYYQNGKIMSSTPCCNYRPNGTYRSWHDDGSKHEEVTMEDGFRVGQYYEWYPNGKVKSKGNYDEYSSKIGIWYFYNEKGQKDSIINYDTDFEDLQVDDLMWITEDLDGQPKQQYVVNFVQKLPSVHFLNSQNGTYLKVTEENKFEVLEKYSKILVQINVDTKSKATYTILTPMKEKHRLIVEQFFLKNPTFDYPFSVMGTKVACKIMMEIEYRAGEEN